MAETTPATIGVELEGGGVPASGEAVVAAGHQGREDQQRVISIVYHVKLWRLQRAPNTCRCLETAEFFRAT